MTADVKQPSRAKALASAYLYGALFFAGSAGPLAEVFGASSGVACFLGAMFAAFGGTLVYFRAAGAD